MDENIDHRDRSRHMVNQARGEHYSLHAVEDTGKQCSILQFRSAHNEGDNKGTSDGRTSSCPASRDTAVASTRTLPAAAEGQTRCARCHASLATTPGTSKKRLVDDVVVKPCSGHDIAISEWDGCREDAVSSSMGSKKLAWLSKAGTT